MEMNESAFKICYKYLKSKNPLPDLSRVVNFAKRPFQHTEFFQPLSYVNRSSYPNKKLAEVGLNPPETWEIYSSTQHEGVYVIRNPFSSAGQRIWIRKCLETYPHKPNLTNIGDLLAEEAVNPNKCRNVRDFNPLNKLRWVTIGVHHNWKTKVYDFNYVTEFPEDLSKLSKCVADVIGYRSYRPEAAIVNYYSMNSSFGGHTDHSEFDHSSPLLSYSFGQTAVFLLGGLSLDIEPTPIFLQSGDILILHGKSRLVYHGVPCILEAKCKPWTEEHDIDDDWKFFERYISKSRINMSVRQVFVSQSE